MDRCRLFGHSISASKLLLIVGALIAASAQQVLAKGNTISSQIHNAPGWLASHTYTFSGGPPNGHFMRVVNGAGWNGSSFVSYQPLNAYELVSPGTCTSASSGGPSGTGASIGDGTCTWKYLSRVDYVTLTGWFTDSGVAWKSGTINAFYDVIMTEATLQTFELLSPGCVSTIQPTPRTSEKVLADGCQWQYIGDVIYTSGANHIPIETFRRWDITACIGAEPSCTTSGNNLYVTAVKGTLDPLANNAFMVGGVGVNAKITGQMSGTPSGMGVYTLSDKVHVDSEQMVVVKVSLTYFQNADTYEAVLWNDREYVAGSNGEANPLVMQNHNSLHNDSMSADYTHGGSPMRLTVASGEDFGTTLRNNQSLPLSGYDANLGVALRNSSGHAALCMQDNSVMIYKMQVKSNGNAATSGMGFACGALWRSCNNCQVWNSILEADGTSGYSIVEYGADTIIANSLLLTAGKGGMIFDYPGYLWNSTIVNIGSQTDTVGVQSSYNWVFTCGVAYEGNAVYGFTTAFAAWRKPVVGTCANTLDQLTVNGRGNITDTPNGGGPGGTWFGDARSPTNAYTHPGTTYNVSGASAFVSYPGNYRVTPSSALYGARSAVGEVDLCIRFAGWPTDGAEDPSCHYKPDATDIIGTARPQSGRYDVGAIQSPSSTPRPRPSQP